MYSDALVIPVVSTKKIPFVECMIPFIECIVYNPIECYKYLDNPIYRMYHPIEISSYN